MGMAGPEVTADAGWGPRRRPQGRHPSLGCCRFMPSSPFSSQASLVPAEPVPPQRRAAARDGPPGRTVPPGTCPLAGGQLGDHPVTHPRAHSHSSVHPHSVFCSGLSAGTRRGDQMNTPLARPLQGRGLRAAGGGDAAAGAQKEVGTKSFLSTRLCLCGSCLKERTRPCVPRFPQAWARTGGWRVCAGECALASVL